MFGGKPNRWGGGPGPPGPYDSYGPEANLNNFSIIVNLDPLESKPRVVP